jgi:hypothetical protein
MDLFGSGVLNTELQVRERREGCAKGAKEDKKNTKLLS